MVQIPKDTTTPKRVLSPLEGPLDLEEIKQVLFCKCIEHGVIEPLKRFFRKMVLEWGRTPTAHATRRNGIPVIVLGRKFFRKHVHSTDHAADILMHEISHHLMDFVHNREVLGERFGARRINIAEDAIINAQQHLLKNRRPGLTGFAGFMENFYEDKGVYAFLRPNSRNVQVGVIEDGEEKDAGELFYDRLYRQEVSLEEACLFFEKYFPNEGMDKPLLGSHSDEPPNDAESDDDDEDDGGEPMPMPGRDQGLFDRGEGLEIARELGLAKVSNRARNNFRRIVQQIVAAANKPGSIRSSPTFRRKMPAKLSQFDLIGIERGREVYRGWKRISRRYKIFFDVSGSMESYIPFVAALIKDLVQAGHEVELYCWADTLEKVEVATLGTTAKPKVGSGTRGEEVAKFLAANNIADAVIITDNAAGPIETRVKTKVHVCLVPFSSTEGSFLDKTKMPNSTAHQLIVD